jgi:hypothetical protein
MSYILLLIYEMLTLQAEQNAIRKINEEGNQTLTWSQTRNMPISSKVCHIQAMMSHLH